MIQKNPYAAYNNSKIQTATPAELTLLLYDGAIKFANIAAVAIEKGDIEKAHNNIRKTENIIREFQVTLDHKYAVAKDFDAVYTYLLQRLLEVNMKKDKDILEEVLDICVPCAILGKKLWQRLQMETISRRRTR